MHQNYTRYSNTNMIRNGAFDIFVAPRVSYIANADLWANLGTELGDGPSKISVDAR